MKTIISKGKVVYMDEIIRYFRDRGFGYYYTLERDVHNFILNISEKGKNLPRIHFGVKRDYKKITISIISYIYFEDHSRIVIRYDNRILQVDADLRKYLKNIHKEIRFITKKNGRGKGDDRLEEM